MKGIIRKTGEKITIVSYGGRIDRNDTLDYVSYIDNHGKEHPREKLNLYWDIEVINDNQAILEEQARNTTETRQLAKASAEKVLTKREAVALNIYCSIINGIHAHGSAGLLKPEEIAEKTLKLTDMFMDSFM